MSETKQVRITGNDIQSLNEKLVQFEDSLPENEKNVMGWLIQRASEAPADSDVAGYFSQLGSQQFQSSALLRSPAYRGLGASQIGPINPGVLAGVSIVVGVMF